MLPLCLDFLTVSDAGPARQVAIAADNGVHLVNLLLEPGGPEQGDWTLIGDTPQRRETKRRCQDLGVGVDMVEVFRINAGTTHDGVLAYRAALESSAWLGARRINVLTRKDGAEGRSAEELESRLLERFAQLAELCADAGLAITTELSRRMMLETVPDALRFLERLGRTDVSLLIDSLHHFRFRGTVQQVRDAGAAIGRLQISDGPADCPVELQFEEALHERLIPGEGTFPLRELLAALPDGTTVGIEVPLESWRARGISAEDRAARAIAATRTLLPA